MQAGAKKATCEFGPVNESKVREFNYILAHPEDPAVQRRWWVQHTPLQTLDEPYGEHCKPKRNGCLPSDPAFIRCSSVPGANRAAVPNKTQGWPVCFNMLDTKQARALGPEPLPPKESVPARPHAALPVTSGPQRPLFYSFGLANEWQPDDELGAMGFEVHSFDPTSRFYWAHMRHKEPGVHFHYFGLQSSISSCRSGKTGTRVYGGLGGRLMSLRDIRRKLGHERRPIGALKIDCGGQDA